LLNEARDFDEALRTARIVHTTDFYGCGIHSMRYWQRDLHAFWPLMAHALGSPPPVTFDYRRADPEFSVWGWTFEADANRATESLDIRDASKAGLALTGSGTETVTTAGYFHPAHPRPQVGTTAMPGQAGASVLEFKSFWIGTNPRI
jgi:hypothetical protein